MWGFYNERDRNLGKQIFKNLTDQLIASKYHESGTETKDGPDQFFLHDYVYPIIRSRSTIHDSYLCKQYNDSEPFPTERVGFCYVAVHHNFIEKCATNDTLNECPMLCRPVENKNWKYC